MRDGLQVEKQVVPTEKKITWIDKLISAGVGSLQIGSFVHPVKVPQMADTDELFRYYAGPGKKPAGVVLAGLVLNEKGLDRARACSCGKICLGVSASETHSLKNTGMSVDDAVSRIIAMAKEVMVEGRALQVAIQSAFGCGFEGRIPEEKVIGIAGRFVDAGIRSISLADTAGHAYPGQVRRLYGAISAMGKELELVSHFHNTYGLGIANCIAAMESGVTVFETAFGGLGGCPFTKVAAGNVTTEDFVHLLNRNGINSGIDIDKIIDLTKEASDFFGKALPGYVYKTGAIKY